MTLKSLANDRMLYGGLAHPDQSWNELSQFTLMAEAREEIADCYNYFSRSPWYKKIIVYPMLHLLFLLTK